jgi:hypothetical protein
MVLKDHGVKSSAEESPHRIMRAANDRLSAHVERRIQQQRAGAPLLHALQ